MAEVKVVVRLCPSTQSTVRSSKRVVGLPTVVTALLLVIVLVLATIAGPVFVLDGHVSARVAAGVVGGGASEQFA